MCLNNQSFQGGKFNENLKPSPGHSAIETYKLFGHKTEIIIVVVYVF